MTYRRRTATQQRGDAMRARSPRRVCVGCLVRDQQVGTRDRSADQLSLATPDPDSRSSRPQSRSASEGEDVRIITLLTHAGMAHRNLRTGAIGWEAMGKRECLEEGCSKWPQSTGYCVIHGGGRRCHHVGCAKPARSGTHHCRAHEGDASRCQTEGCGKAAAEGGTPHCVIHGGGVRCHHKLPTGPCTKPAADDDVYCKLHGGGRRCIVDGCLTGARDGKHCYAHGGGRHSCREKGCTKAARDATGFCKAHGGGRRCQHEGCSKSAEGVTDNCVAHGGGKRCQHEGCDKAAATGGSQHCRPHGGGKRCSHEGCTKSAVGGGTPHCKAHGGGKRCQEANCKASARSGTNQCKAHGLTYGAGVLALLISSHESAVKDE